MVESWLRKNCRIEILRLVLSSLLVLPGPLLTLFAAQRWLHGIGVVWTACGVMALAAQVLQGRLPLVGRQGDELLFYLNGWKAIRVPLEIVEVFFLGQGESEIGSPDKRAETSNVVVRLAEKAESWQKVPVRSRLARWCDGYITIRGMWTEPLSLEVVKQLNHRLVTAKREGRNRRGNSSSAPHTADIPT